MAQYIVTMAGGNRGAVIKETINADGNDPWPRALQVLSQRVRKGDGVMKAGEEQVLIRLTPVAAQVASEGSE